MKIASEEGGRYRFLPNMLDPETYLSPLVPIRLVGERMPEQGCRDSEIQKMVSSTFLFPERAYARTHSQRMKGYDIRAKIL